MATNLDDKKIYKSNFVFIKNEIIKYKVRQYEIGIIINESHKEYDIYFIVSNQTIKVNRNNVESFNPLETGDLFDKKVCNVCHRLLDTIQFSKNQSGINNRPIRRPSCDECRKTIDGTNILSTEKVKWNKFKPYLIPFECPICRKRTIPGLTSKVVLDHNHTTGEARGWICDSCNTGLGRFKDNINLLKSAIEFIEKK